MILNEISQAVVTVGAPAEEKTEIWVHDATLLPHLKHSVKKDPWLISRTFVLGWSASYEISKTVFLCGSFKEFKSLKGCVCQSVYMLAIFFDINCKLTCQVLIFVSYSSSSDSLSINQAVSISVVRICGGIRVASGLWLFKVWQLLLSMMIFILYRVTWCFYFIHS